jgi:hypothetical protein
MATKFQQEPDARVYVVQYFSAAANAWQGIEHFRTSKIAIRRAGTISKKDGVAVRVMLLERWIIFSVEVGKKPGKAK